MIRQPDLLQEKQTVRKPFIALFLLGYCLYLGIFIYHTSFVFEGKRYYLLTEDAMISMRYARNLAHGFGLVFNPAGERIEGYTNFLFVLFLSLIHLAPLTTDKISLVVQITGAVFLVTNLLVLRRIASAISNRSNAIIFFSVLLTAFYYPLNRWCLIGSEVAPLTVIVSFAVWVAIKTIQEKQFTPAIYWLLGAGTLIRLDLSVIYLAIFSFLFFFDHVNRKKHLVWGLGLLLLFLGSQTIFRMYYFGEPLPNTYYLKLTGFPLFLRITRGFYIFALFASRLNWILFLLPFALLLWRRTTETMLIAWVFFCQCLYSIFIGGDIGDTDGGSDRFASIVMPLFFILFSYAIVNIVQALRPPDEESELSQIGTFGLAFLVLFFIGSWLNFNYMGPLFGFREIFTLRPNALLETNNDVVRRASWVCKITKPSATIAVVRAGVIPYLCDRNTIDLLGKNDRTIAHETAHLDQKNKYTMFYPGHMKWDYDYAIGQRKPDVIVELWGDLSKAYPYLRQDYVGVNFSGFFFYLRKESPNIRWEHIVLK